MSRINDVGGMAGFPAIVEEPDEPRFHADWEAHVFALNGALIQRGVYNLDEFRDAQERLPVAQLLGSSYYERWFAAITTLLVEKGVATATELAAVTGPVVAHAPGDRVRTRTVDPAGHTRLPRYARGATGTVVAGGRVAPAGRRPRPRARGPGAAGLPRALRRAGPVRRRRPRGHRRALARPPGGPRVSDHHDQTTAAR